MIRDVKFMGDTDKIAAFREAHGDQFVEAYSYLALWSFTTYDTVSITFLENRDGWIELLAHYQQAGDTRCYVIGAVWDRQNCTFSFHS